MEMIASRAQPHLGGNIRHGDVRTFTPKLWRFLVERYSVKSVLDVGCGEGHATSFFRGLGIVAHGIDGLKANVDRAVTPICLHDLTSSSYYMPVDLSWSCEVAEHIEEKYIGNYIETLSCGKIIAMTHAVVGQSGHHHVNCQPPEYWIERMRAAGYTLAYDNKLFRHIAKSEGYFNYFSETGLVFTRSGQ